MPDYPVPWYPSGLKKLAGSPPDPKTLFDIVWEVVKECGEEERHFNNLQSVYRGIASTWLLGTFGAVGYLLFNKDSGQSEHHELLASLICLAGAFGVAMLWMLDLGVYHRLLVAVFEEGHELEKEFPWLPRFRTNMAVRPRQQEDPVLRKLGYYYLGTIGVVLIAALWFAQSSRIYCPTAPLVLVLCLWLAEVAGVIVLFVKTTRDPANATSPNAPVKECEGKPAAKQA